MVNFHDPKVIQSDAAASKHFSFILVGIFLWEFVTTVDFEWKYVTEKRKFKWPLLLYSACRICTLASTICGLINTGVTHEINCQLWTTWNHIFIGISFTCASMLVTIRVIAVWNHNYLVMAVTIGMWITNVGFLLYGVIMMRAEWSSISRNCALGNLTRGRYNIVATTVNDVAQLVIMLIGLLRTRREKHGFLRYLYIQGLTWLVGATIAEIPCAVFIVLNLNEPWNGMFQQFAFYTMVICATRLYRSLILYNMDINKFSNGLNATSSLRFGAQPRNATLTGAGTGTGSTVTVIPTDRSDSALPRAKDLEISLAEKVTSDGDEEAESHQSHKVPSLLGYDGPYA